MLKGNYIDLIIILVLLYFATEAFRHGFWIILVDFISFLGSIVFSFWSYKFVVLFLKSNFSLSSSISNAAGFLLVAIISESILSFLLAKLLTKLPERYWKNKIIKFFAVIPALGEGLILIAFILTLTIATPLKPSIKRDVVSSKIGSYILKKAVGVEKSINEIFGGVIEDSLTYLTVKPGSKEKVSIDSPSGNLTVDEETARQMLELVNSERRKLGIRELNWSDRITKVSEDYARYMWENHYFGHVSPDGKDVGDRLTSSKIKYQIAGENLALAPTLQTAHTGLMNSQGHRENILNKDFSRIGIGVVDNGIYGKIFVQVFAD